MRRAYGKDVDLTVHMEQSEMDMVYNGLEQLATQNWDDDLGDAHFGYADMVTIASNAFEVGWRAATRVGAETFDCVDCGTRSAFMSEQQKHLVVNQGWGQCSTCYRAEVRWQGIEKLMEGVNARMSSAIWYPVNSRGGFCYQVWADADELLYVGSTRHPVGHRLRQHEKKTWWHQAHHITAEFFNSWQDAESAEAMWIEGGNPKHNQTRPKV